MHSRSILGRRLLGKTFGASGSEGMGSAAVLYRDRTTPGSLGNSLRVRLRHSLCFCSKSNNLYALTQHTRDTLLTPQRRGSGIRLGRERHKGRSAPVSTSHRLSAAGHPRPFFVTAFGYSISSKYTTRGGGCQDFRRKKFNTLSGCFAKFSRRDIVARRGKML